MACYCFRELTKNDIAVARAVHVTAVIGRTEVLALCRKKGCKGKRGRKVKLSL